MYAWFIIYDQMDNMLDLQIVLQIFYISNVKIVLKTQSEMSLV